MFLFHSFMQGNVAGEFGRAKTMFHKKRQHNYFSRTQCLAHCFAVVISGITPVISMKGLLG